MCSGRYGGRFLQALQMPKLLRCEKKITNLKELFVPEDAQQTVPLCFVMGISKKRYFKRSRKAQQKMITDKARKARQLAQRPPMHRVDKKERMLAIFNSGRTNQRALFLDLDGTLIEYVKSTRSRKKPRFRPYFDDFVT